jgi:DNA-binding PadR family transcriptional regulator
MYRDNTLIPTEAIRLLALGLLADRPRTYAELAREVRHFTSHMVGPSLDLVAHPLELLKVEGLVAPTGPDGKCAGEPALAITAAGGEALAALLSANVRPPVNDTNKLIIALKMRFLHLLPQPEQRHQAEMLAEMCERELARMIELRAHDAEVPGRLIPWLDQEIAQTRERLTWFAALRDSLG